MPRLVRLAALVVVLVTTAPAAYALTWHTTWDDGVFADAARQHRFVLLDLHAVWCHWCHVMDQTTYADPKVQALIGRSFVAVSVDADSDPDLTARYGNWGWPATIVLAADGSEIVKRRGYIAPAQMASLLQAIIDDPSPGPSVTAALSLAPRATGALAPGERTALESAFDQSYDEQYGGWGSEHKFIDAPSLELLLARADDGDAQAERRARQTLDANLALIDPVWGGVYQYSDAIDWKSPHFEKLMAFQADDLRLYSEAYGRWADPRYGLAARAIYGYLVQFLAAPDGGFYVSQDADVSEKLTGHQYYALSDAARRAAGMPRVDTHEYSRETGWAVRALCRWSDTTGEAAALDSAQRGASWALTQRRTADGGFRHDAQDRGGPFLDDNVAMAEALVALYASTGTRRWLVEARRTLDFVGVHFTDPRGGYIAAPASGPQRGVFREPVRSPETNAALVRVANLVAHYTGDERYSAMARHGLKFMAALAASEQQAVHPDIQLADRELAAPPTHITVVGPKGDPVAMALHGAARRYPAGYVQIDWWDRSEGPLPNPTIRYPVLKRPAAFACTETSCSLPVYDATALLDTVRAARTQ
jgi:uncharacterized protein YyaL (SSP411 family)